MSGAFHVSKFLAITDELYATIPVPVAVVDYQPYMDVYDMAERVRREGILHISNLHGPTYWSSSVTIKARAIHDWYAHILPGNSFSWEGEVNAYKASLALYPKDLHWMVYSELILQVAQLLVYRGVEQKIVYCRGGEPLRTYEAWRLMQDRVEGPQSRQEYRSHVKQFLASAELPFSVPILIESQF